MRKLIFALAAVLCCMSINAQVMNVMKGNRRVATYYASQADRVVFDKEPDTMCELLELELNNRFVANIYPDTRGILASVPEDFTGMEDMTVTRLRVSKDARSNIKEGDHLDLSTDKVLTVTNGSQKKDWLLQVKKENSRLFDFYVIGDNDQYHQGTINEEKKEVTLSLYPGSGVDLTNATFSASINGTATCSPQNGSRVDFTEPLVLTITDGSAVSEYTVRVTMASAPEILYVSSYSNIMEGQNKEEKAAATWITTNMDNAVYASWSDILAEKIPLDNVKMVVWHAHGSIPSRFSDFQNYYPDAMYALFRMRELFQRGTGFVLSRSAVFYAAALGAVSQDLCPNNCWGGWDEGSDMMGNDPWHFFPTDADHPLWTDLKQGPDPNGIYTLDPGYTISNITAQYAFWNPYQDVASFEAKVGARALAGDSYSCSVWEFPNAKGQFGTGGIICIGSGLFDWYSPTPYTSNWHDNMGQIIRNAWSYVGNTQQHDPGETGYIQPKEEDACQTYYKPEVGTVGDPMPFYDKKAGDFKVMYLQEYPRNDYFCFHPYWAVSTQDGASYQPLGEWLCAGPFSTQQDAALGTGCCYYNEADGLYYIYYTGESRRTADRQVVMRATSADLKTWNRDNLWSLKGRSFGFDSHDFRDPQIFRVDGMYHMVISTRPATGGDPCFAEFVSEDMRNWKLEGQFRMIWDRMLECPDVFEMNGKWYLVYSESTSWSRKVKYMMGDSWDDLRNKFNNGPQWPDSQEGVLDNRAFYAGKTASDGNDRYIWGWCPTRPDGDNANVGNGENGQSNEPQWSGALVCHKVAQREDGTLYLTAVPAMATKYNKPSELKVMEQEGNYTLYNRLGYHNHISFTAKMDNGNGRFGVSFARGTGNDSFVTLKFNNPHWDTSLPLLRTEYYIGNGGTEDKFINGAEGIFYPISADNTYNVDIYTDNSVVVVYINGTACMTARIYGIENNCWSVNNYGGATFSDIRVTQY